MSRRLILVLAFLVLMTIPAASSAQGFNPYAPPFPGAVPYQPCGGEVGWAPAGSPAAAIGICMPPPAEPNPEQPWTVDTDKPMEIGKAYRDPYGLVKLVTRIESRLVRNIVTGEWSVVWSGEVLLYQSIDDWRNNRNPYPVVYDPTESRGPRWEIK